MPQHISDELLQVYFFRAEPSHFKTIGECIEEIGRDQRVDCNGEVDLWVPYYWLGRHSHCVIRAIRRTSGLDKFLIKDGGIPGVYDVAEIMAYQWRIDDSNTSTLSPSFREVRQSIGEEHLLFICFVKLAWDLLSPTDGWKCLPERPGRTDVVYGFTQSLKKALSMPATQELIGANLKMSVSGGIGDADILLVGATTDRESLDALLHVANQIGIDSIGAALYGESAGKQLPSTCAVRDTITELGVPLELYLKVFKEARSQANDSAAIPAGLSNLINKYMAGSLGGDISLKRSHTGLEDLRTKIVESIGSEWLNKLMLGEVDIRLSSPKMDLSEVLWLLARLDAKASEDPLFPHRLGLEITVGSPLRGNPSRAGRSYNRYDIVGVEGNIAPIDNRLDTTTHAVNPTDINIVLNYLEHARSKDLREDLRIVERMVERCVTLQKNPELPANTRYIVKQAFNRIVRIIKKIEALDEQRNISLSSASTATKDDAHYHEELANWCDIHASLDRLSLLNAGMHFDRALSQHVRGSINFLLSPSVQARGPDHFGSELVLSYGLSAAPQSAVKRIIQHLGDAEQNVTAANQPLWLKELRTDLEIIAEPIIYASHDTDFALVPALGMIRTPRWVLWYPTKSSFVLHEIGHALSEVGELSYVATAFLKAFQDPAVAEHVYLLGLHELARDFANNDLLLSTSPALDFLIEVVADVICRLFVHGRQSSLLHVEDCLDYLRIMATRMVPLERHQFLERLLSAFVASEQLYACHQEDPSILWKKNYRKRFDELKEQFFGCLESWLNKQPVETGEGHGNDVMISNTHAIQSVKQFIEIGEPENWRSELGPSIRWGQFFAYLCVTEPIPTDFSSAQALREPTDGTYIKPMDQSDISLLRGQTLFHALWHATKPLDTAEEEAIENICKMIADGIIPEVSDTPYPERLARGVHWAFINRARPDERTVPINVRFALSLYLSNIESKLSSRSRTNNLQGNFSDAS